MRKFSIFSHSDEPQMRGLRRTEIEGDERDAERSARMLEVLGQQVDGVIGQVDGHLSSRARQGSSRARQDGGR